MDGKTTSSTPVSNVIGGTTASSTPVVNVMGGFSIDYYTILYSIYINFNLSSLRAAYDE